MAGNLTLTVSQLNEYIRRTLQLDPMLRRLEIRGEISNLKFHQTGSVFFTLKDEQAAISCVMYASDAENLNVMPFDGMRVVASGSVSLYVKGGQMQLYVSRLRAEGVGVLYERLLALKAKLSAEGLFLPERKRQLPAYPDTVGVVSSPTGAVIHDIMNVSLRRDPQVRILLCPSRVQGMGAAEEIASAIRILDRMDSVSVIIVARGGGSMEDLWAFNEEVVVRAVAACSKPVVSAVGHETDVTLCDLAADYRAPTPSAAAECVVPVRADTEERIHTAMDMLRAGVQVQLDGKEHALAMMKAQLAGQKPSVRIAARQEQLQRHRKMLKTLVHTAMLRSEESLSARRRELELLSPYRVLSRGYAIVHKNGLPVRAASCLSAGEGIVIRFADGAVQAKVESSSQEETK